ncbi:MAG: hypothetical protein JJ895_12115 [Balneolaceae bacterium]|nr:hypothetical protein [Balneolaceae bacterium]
MIKSFALVLCLALFTFCTNTPDTNPTETAVTDENAGSIQFWDQLSSLCGKSFEGELVSDPVEGFAGKKLVMHVLSCDEEQILVPFNVGDNLSRTWIFTSKEGNRIELKHDHRMEDGSDDEVTMYGGTSTNAGTSNMQLFPADQETLDNIPYAFSNVWWVTLSDSVYSYNLRRIGRPSVFTIEFDLTNEIETPEPSWGWEDFGE